MKFVVIIFIFFASTSYPLTSIEKLVLQKYKSGIPTWMKTQIEKDLSYFRNKQIPIGTISEYYNQSSPDLMLIKFTIKNNRVYSEWKDKNSPGLDYRRSAFEDALKSITKVLKLPNVTFLISMHDAYTLSQEAPVFSMCKREIDQTSILVPDFDALRAKFQVLPDQDLITYEPAWERKKELLIWRGSTAQGSLDGELMRYDNVHRFSRVILCQLSQKYPELIDAKFTYFAQNGENIPYLQIFNGEHISFADFMNYKYQIFIDGNVSPYSASGWKFFTNSLIFKVDSPWLQWYFDALKPYEHYIPVKEDLADLIEQIQWAKSHEYESRLIAKKCREFALSHITLPDNLLYLYCLICEYSRLNFIN